MTTNGPPMAARQRIRAKRRRASWASVATSRIWET